MFPKDVLVRIVLRNVSIRMIPRDVLVRMVPRDVLVIKCFHVSYIKIVFSFNFIDPKSFYQKTFRLSKIKSKRKINIGDVSVKIVPRDVSVKIVPRDVSVKIVPRDVSVKIVPRDSS